MFALSCPPLPAGQAPGQNTVQECSQAPICFLGGKVCIGFLNYIDNEGSLQEKGRGKGCFSHLYFVLTYVDKKRLRPCRRYGYGWDHCAGACEREKAERRGGGEPGAPAARSRDGPDASSGRKSVQGHPSVRTRWEWGNSAIAKCSAGCLSGRRTSRGMSLRERARRSFAPRLPGDAISAVTLAP